MHEPERPRGLTRPSGRLISVRRDGRPLDEARDEVALRLDERDHLRARRRAPPRRRGLVLRLPVDPEQMGVLAADPQDEKRPSHSTLKLRFVIPPPSGSTRNLRPGQTRAAIASTCTAADPRPAALE